MSSVWGLLFFGMIAAAKVGCRSSCTRSKSQADKGEITWAELPAWSKWFEFCVSDLHSFEWDPQKQFIWKATAKSGLLSRFWFLLG